MFDNLFLVPLQYAPARSRAKAYAFSRSPMLLPITAADRQTAHIQRMKAFSMHRMMYIFAILVYLFGFVNRIHAPSFAARGTPFF